MTQITTAYRKKWRYDVHRGVHRLIDSGPTREHIAGLLDQGASVRGIAEAAGISPSVVSRLRLGRQPSIRRPVAAALGNVTMTAIVGRPNGAGFVPNLGARRRIQAMLAIGWRHEDINAATGKGRSQVILAQAGDWISRDNHDAIARAYAQLAGRPGPSAATRGRAAKLGYAPPAAWDDDTIDDPAALPQHLAPEQPGAGVDQVAVLRRMGGDRTVELTRAERWVVVRRLNGQGLDDQEISRLTGIWDRQVLRDRKSLGLPAVPQHTRGKPHGGPRGPRGRGATVLTRDQSVAS